MLDPADTAERVLILDFGSQVTQLIARRLRESGVYCEIWPFNADPARIAAFNAKAFILSGGPASVHEGESPRAPQMVFEQGVPVLGICLGEQVVGMSQGVETFKLKYGHRGQNKPCLDLTTGRGYVTSQNHGYALEKESLSKTELRPWFINADDGTIEGVIHSHKPCMAVQFHPEATPGPYDTNFVFDRFVEVTEGSRFRGEQIRSVKA